MKGIRFIQITLLIFFSVIISNNLFGEADSLSSSYFKISHVKAENIEDTRIRDFINKRFSHSYYYRANHSQYFKDLYFIIDSAKSDKLSILYSFDDQGIGYTRCWMEKTKDDMYFTNTDLKTKDDLVLNDIFLVSDPAKHIIFYKWSNPAGKNEPSISDKNKLMPGSLFPELKFRSFGDKDINVLKNRITVINWWATSCLPCVEEIPGLNKLVEKYKDKEIDFIAVVSDNENAEKFLSKHSFSYLQCYSGSDSPEYFGKSFPRHLIIDRDRKIVYNRVGGSEFAYQELDKVIEELLAKKSE